MIMNSAAKDPNCRLFVSFYQIYNEKINDLYNYTNQGLDIREAKNGDISIPDLVTVRVTKMQEAIQFLMVGLKVPPIIVRTGPRFRRRPTPKAPGPTLSSRSALSEKRGRRSSARR